MSDLALRHCSATVDRLDDSAARALLGEVPGWHVDGGKLVKSFAFASYPETLLFTNMVGWIAHREDHHPDLLITYRGCRVAFSTHSVDGLSLNDFICAARIDALGAA